MSRTIVTTLHTRYKLQTNKFVATFEVDSNGRMTFFKSPDSSAVKEYHFECSDPVVVKAIAKLLGQAAKVAEQQIKGKESKK